MRYLYDYMKAVTWVISTLVLLFIVSCKDDDNEVGGFNVDQTDLQFSNDGGDLEVRIAANETWTATSESDWCLVSPANGAGNGVCVIKADSSYMYKSRTGRVVFYSDGGSIAEVTVKQFGYEPTIEFSKSEITIPSYAPLDEAYIDVEAIANVPFEVVIPDGVDWLSLKDEKDNAYVPSTTIPRKKTFRFVFKTQTDFADRSVDIQFNQTKQVTARGGEAVTESLNKIVKVKQEGAPRIIPSREGDSLAILAMARVLMGGNPGWSTSRPITHWSNVEVEERTYQYEDGNIQEERTELRVVGLRLTMFDTKESIPYQVKFLTELETLVAASNSNGYMKKIKLGPEIVECKNLRCLSLMGYGICELPSEMAEMTWLEELDMNGNTFTELPMGILSKMTGLKYLDFGGNRVSGAVMNLKTDVPKGMTLKEIGITGSLPEALFRMYNLEYLYLSYNYFTGSIPEMGGKDANVMPNLKQFTVNLNRLTGNVPDWILYHPNVICWNPFMLVFNQEGYDDNGAMAIMPNAPDKITSFPAGAPRTCPLDEEKENAVMTSLKLRNDGKLPELTEEDYKSAPLGGHWRYYKVLNEEWRQH